MSMLSMPSAAVPMPELAFGLADPRVAATMTGLEQMRAIVERRFPAPPIVEVMQQWIHEMGEGHVTFLGDPHARYLNPMGLIHGGWAMTLLDSALGCAVQTVLARGETYASLGTEVKFLRPILAETGQVRCRAEVENRGRNTATASGRIEDSTGRLLATGTTTCFIRSAGAE
ncbi:PaaI family thioesterase [Pseudodonghicola xiamenensis]|uniref:Aromatic compound catabolic protein n=1 Tax=Pseudodonghicola xiamenensis TaxID=337702 RepID=A0A8J3H7N9_9RHOB|nr:PaaI family thioesterase [Pseudodonghicola xiamenensis]GHG97163.1 aromatic compound catabolic protein [Pseudodonghicola xiamenensis]